MNGGWEVVALATLRLSSSAGVSPAGACGVSDGRALSTRSNSMSGPMLSRSNCCVGARVCVRWWLCVGGFARWGIDDCSASHTEDTEP